jgi:hypothetical protein
MDNGALFRVDRLIYAVDDAIEAAIEGFQVSEKWMPNGSAKVYEGTPLDLSGTESAATRAIYGLRAYWEQALDTAAGRLLMELTAEPNPWRIVSKTVLVWLHTTDDGTPVSLGPYAGKPVVELEMSDGRAYPLMALLRSLQAFQAPTPDRIGDAPKWRMVNAPI